MRPDSIHQVPNSSLRLQATNTGRESSHSIPQGSQNCCSWEMDRFPNPKDGHLTPHYHPMSYFKHVSFKQEYIAEGWIFLEIMASYTHPRAWKENGALTSLRLVQSKVGTQPTPDLLHSSLGTHPSGSANVGWEKDGWMEELKWREKGARLGVGVAAPLWALWRAAEQRCPLTFGKQSQVADAALLVGT